ncbi:hypothetical protein CRUP_000058, partial [Coryphaenoides rupestris]
DRKKFYVLSMFPYPSGRLHMGHVRVYTISDALGHFQRMRGHQRDLVLPDVARTDGGWRLNSASITAEPPAASLPPELSCWPRGAAGALLEGSPLLDALADLPEWYGVKAMQANWIGDCSGCYFDFQLKVRGEETGETLAAYTPSPEALYGAAYLALLPSHWLLQGSSPARSALEEALQPGADSLTEGQEIPLVISRQQAFDGHLDAVIGSRSFGLTAARRGISVRYAHSSQASPESRAFDSITQKARERQSRRAPHQRHAQGLADIEAAVLGHAHPRCALRLLRPSGGARGGSFPVVLPKLPSLTGKGASPLEAAHDWLHCTCPRYTDPRNTERPFERRAVDHWLPVDVYVGGKEHAVLHLYYARFLSHFCCDQGLVAHREPFRKLLVQGLIKGQTFRLAGGGPYVRREDIDFSGEEPVAAGGPLEVTWEKMSKSKHNGLDPQEVVAQYGLDTRVSVCFCAPLSPADALPGVLRWQSRLWLLVSRLRAARELGPVPDASLLKKKELAEAKSIWQHKNHTVEQ